MILSIRNCVQLLETEIRPQCLEHIWVHPCNRNGEANMVPLWSLKSQKPFFSLLNHFCFMVAIFNTSTSTGIPAIMSTFQIGKRRKRGKEGKGTCKGTPHPQGDIPNLLFYFFPPQNHFASYQPYIKIEISSMFILTRTFPAESHVVFAIICCPIHNLLADMKIWRPEYGTVVGRQIWHAQSIKHIEYPPCAR